jgi:hypothetical protein
MLKSKTERIRKEFEELPSKNASLAQLILDLNDFVSLEFNKDVVMTHIFRTQEDQKALYAKEAKQNKSSPHMRWEAVDIRDWIYDAKEKKAIGKFLKEYYDATNEMNKLPSGSRTYWLHSLKSNAMHFHIQYRGTLVYVFSQGAVIRGRPQMNSNSTTKAVNPAGSGAE